MLICCARDCQNFRPTKLLVFVVLAGLFSGCISPDSKAGVNDQDIIEVVSTRSHEAGCPGWDCPEGNDIDALEPGVSPLSYIGAAVVAGVLSALGASSAPSGTF